ncbi:MAG TPA: sigma-54 dependent transcriptional regulator [Pelomicrobium sp.]|nr:sigma-54 dependent transcriptional regulator [Pelomicrobium sp.]
MTDPARLLIVDDEAVALANLEHVMRREGHAVTTATSGAAALALLERAAFDVVLTDVRMEHVDGMQVLARCRATLPDAEVILITGYATAEAAVAAMKQGAFYYVAKPYRLEEVRKVVAEAVAKVRLKRENRTLRERIRTYESEVRFITRDAETLRVLETARQVAPTGCNVLIIGETGTGKELLARTLHAASDRAGGPYLAINCGAFNEELLASELFGHERGAFTGAVGARRGLVQAASGGTLFLDEITEMPLAMQVKLLRVVQEREVLPLGSTQPVKVDVRFVAATNRDLQEAVSAGRFRQDLYFRLNVVSLRLPPLSERRGDVPLLAQHFLGRYAARMDKPVRGIAPAAMALLESYAYPGNVRELENIIERGVALATGERIEADQLPPELRLSSLQLFRRKRGEAPTLQEVEREYIRHVLKETNGNQTLAAQTLGIDRVSLWRKLKRYRLGGDDAQ